MGGSRWKTIRCTMLLNHHRASTCKIRFIEFCASDAIVETMFSITPNHVHKELCNGHISAHKICSVRVTSAGLIAASTFKCCQIAYATEQNNNHEKDENRTTARTREMRAFEMWSENGVKLHQIIKMFISFNRNYNGRKSNGTIHRTAIVAK